MKSILVIRRDNIGDLVCTTPLIHALRERYPQARIDALVNSYNLPVVTHNPDLNNVYAYTKGKHRGAGESLIGVIWRRLQLMWQLRATRYELVVLASGGCLPRPLRLARLIRPDHVLGFRDPKVGGAELIDLPVAMPEQRVGHEVESLFALLAPLEITGTPGPLVLRAEPAQQEKALQTLRAQPWYQPGRPTIAVHISARKPSQRWPVERFVTAMRQLAESRGAQFMLFWAPGDENNPTHPGDDRKAQAIIGGLPDDFPLLAWPTHTLQELIGGLAVCHGMLCSDGGAMHVGAALGLPVACFFGQSVVEHWRPWGVAYRVMQPASKDVAEVTVETALESMAALWPDILQRVG